MLNRYAQIAETTGTVEIRSECSRLPLDRTKTTSIIAKSGVEPMATKTTLQQTSVIGAWSCCYHTARIEVLGAHQNGRKTSWRSEGRFWNPVV